MPVPRSRRHRRRCFQWATLLKEASSAFQTPSQPQDPLGHAPEPAQDEIERIHFRILRGTPYVQVINRQPKPHHRRAFTIGQLAPFPQLGLYARGLRAGLHRARLALLSLIVGVPSPARDNLATSHQPNQPSQSFIAHCQPERARRVIERLFHILTSLPVALREALSLSKRISPLE